MDPLSVPAIKQALSKIEEKEWQFLRNTWDIAGSMLAKQLLEKKVLIDEIDRLQGELDRVTKDLRLSTELTQILIAVCNAVNRAILVNDHKSWAAVVDLLQTAESRIHSMGQEASAGPEQKE